MRMHQKQQKAALVYNQSKKRIWSFRPIYIFYGDIVTSSYSANRKYIFHLKGINPIDLFLKGSMPV